MSSPDDDLNAAIEFWRASDLLATGRVAFENLSPPFQPTWAGNILRMTVARGGVQSEPIEHLLQIAERPTEWGNAHRAFSALRKDTLKLERRIFRWRNQTALLYHLYLAENVAKVIYNATEPPDRFDEDAGWWIVPCLKPLIDLWKDNQFSIAAWRVAICKD